MSASRRNAKKASASTYALAPPRPPALRRTARAVDLGLTVREYATLKRLSSPEKIQAFVNAIPINHEIGGETVLSVREVLRQRRAHCIEGAMLAAAALWVNGDPPLVMHLDCDESDYPHVITLFPPPRRLGRDLQDQRRAAALSGPDLPHAARARALVFPRVLEPARPQDAAQLLDAARPAPHRSRRVGDVAQVVLADARPARRAAPLSAHLQASGTPPREARRVRAQGVEARRIPEA